MDEKLMGAEESKGGKNWRNVLEEAMGLYAQDKNIMEDKTLEYLVWKTNG